MYKPVLVQWPQVGAGLSFWKENQVIETTARCHMPHIFNDRSEAGRELARNLRAYAERTDAVVLALPRGGVPVGFEIAMALGVPLDVLVVRKIGAPSRPELAVGAIAPGGVVILDELLIERLGISEHEIVEEANAER